MGKITLDKNYLRKFGLVMALALMIISAVMLLRHKQNTMPPAVLSALFLAFGIAKPLALRPIYIFWMRLAQVLGWINTRLILSLLFYCVFTPMGLVMRLFRVDLLERKIDKRASSYWKQKEEKDFVPADYENQF